MIPPAPTFETIGDGRLTDEAIEALAALLLSVAEVEASKAPMDGDEQDAPSPLPQR